MADTYFIHVTGPYIFNGHTLTCPECGIDHGLRFTTSATGRAVTGNCPSDHIWDERLLPAAAVREAAVQGRG